MYDFLNTCQVYLAEHYPCKDKFELKQRIVYYEALLCEQNNIVPKFIRIKNHNIKDKPIKLKRVSFDEPISNVLYLN